ncbi:HNH endonuclease signature motif containing protein [Euzebya tangerina]|uniref:HNH endonuclease signature motif containing protein n=1 Tax=Euzebya tangerina TaxID=591198 RepID=UPI000E3178CD|nr:HNH endonuclease signature motif containing protein [Euzebya tangerina]
MKRSLDGVQDLGGGGVARTSSGSSPAGEVRAAEVADELVQLASDLFGGEKRFLDLVAEFDALGGWADGRTRSCAHWLNWRLGIAMPAARERVRVARRLHELPLLARVFGEGRVSYSKVRAVTRVATAQTEETLVSFALAATAAQLERICRVWRTVQSQSPASAADAARQRRDVRLTTDDTGDLVLTARLPVAGGAVLAQAIAAAAERLFRDQGPAEDVGQRRADALVAVCESFLASGPTDSSSADHWQLTVDVDVDVLQAARDGQATDHVHTSHQPTSDPSLTDSSPTGPRRIGPRPIGRGSVGPRSKGPRSKGPRSKSPPSGPEIGATVERFPSARVRTSGATDQARLPGPVLRQIACDVTLQYRVLGAGQPVGIGRRHRQIPGWLRRLLYRRDDGCQFPGCPNQLWTDAHHIIHWADDGPTDLDNLIRLCRGHHSTVHAQNLGIGQSRTDRTWTFTTPDGTTICPVPPLQRAGNHLPPASGQVAPASGDPARMALIIDALVDVQQSAAPLGGHRDVSAETSETSDGSGLTSWSPPPARRLPDGCRPLATPPPCEQG